MSEPPQSFKKQKLIRTYLLLELFANFSGPFGNSVAERIVRCGQVVQKPVLLAETFLTKAANLLVGSDAETLQQLFLEVDQHEVVHEGTPKRPFSRTKVAAETKAFEDRTIYLDSRLALRWNLVSQDSVNSDQMMEQSACTSECFAARRANCGVAAEAKPVRKLLTEVHVGVVIAEAVVPCSGGRALQASITE